MSDEKVSISPEVWKPIDESQGKYEVSSWGRIRSVSRWIRPITGQKPYWLKGRILRLSSDKDGYLQTGYKVNGRRVFRKVAALVAEAFLPPCPGEKWCRGGVWTLNHDDGNKTNNAVHNLAWMTLRQNHRHAQENGLIARGVDSHSKVTPQQVREIRRRFESGEHRGRIADAYGISRSNVYRIANRELWDHVT